MQEDIVKVCPDCGSEFQMWVERCLDCGASLVSSVPRPDPGDTFERQESGDPARLLSTSAPRRSGGWRLSEDLDEAGNRHWATPPVWRRDPSLYVLPSDHEAALAIDRARYEVEVPGISAEDALPQPPVRPRRRDPADDLDVKVCPRCGGEYQLRVETCVDCGIALVRPWDLEAASRKEAARAVAPAAPMVPDDPGVCPACGEPVRRGSPNARAAA